MDHTLQRSLIESVAKTLLESGPLNVAPTQESENMASDIEKTFGSMIENVQTIRKNLNRIFSNNGVLCENTTPLTAQRIDEKLSGLLDDFNDLASRHKN